MMLFEFGSSRFTEENKDFPKMVNRLLNENAIVNIIGYSDRTGNDDYNLNLSARRARAVANSLGHPNTTHEGVGGTILL